MSEEMSLAANEILAGLNEALADAKGELNSAAQRTTVYRVQPREVREHLHMSQQEFSKAFGIPLSTLRNWEQGRRQVDTTAAAYLRTIFRFPKEVMAAQI